MTKGQDGSSGLERAKRVEHRDAPAPCPLKPGQARLKVVREHSANVNLAVCEAA